MTTILKVTTEDVRNFIVEELTSIESNIKENLKILIVAIFEPTVNKLLHFNNLEIEFCKPERNNYCGKSYDCAFVLSDVPVEEQLYIMSRLRGISNFTKRYYVINKFNTRRNYARTKD